MNLDKKVVILFLFLLFISLSFALVAAPDLEFLCETVISTGLYTSCPDNTQLLGGGCENPTGLRTVHPSSNNNNYWACDAAGNNYAICCTVPEESVSLGTVAGGARCAEGSTLTGGGCRENRGLIAGSYPISDDLWHCQSNNAFTGGGSISTILAICVDEDDYSCLTVESGYDDVSAFAQCPQDYTVTGGGCNVVDADNRVVSSRPSDNGWSCDSEIPYSDYPNDIDTGIESYARCCRSRVVDPVEETCKDTDGGFDYYTQGSITHSRGDIITFDQCLDDTRLSEGFCGDDVFSEGYDCPYGCKNGACIKEEKKDEKEKLETTLAEISGVGFFSAYWECVDLEEGKVILDFCTSSEFLIEKAKSFCEGICIVSSGENKCGLNSFVVSNKCTVSEKENKCDYLSCDSYFDSELGDCKCKAKSSDEVDDFLVCENSCPLDGKCFPFGYRDGDFFCSPDSKFIDQFKEGQSCDNSFECDSNVCIDNKCISEGLLKKILNWFSSFF
ncbi:MAG: hypothetical protein ACI83O_000847 [Patescibacteria group bacterium]|jgi:hypothetical protein